MGLPKNSEHSWGMYLLKSPSTGSCVPVPKSVFSDVKLNTSFPTEALVKNGKFLESIHYINCYMGNKGVFYITYIMEKLLDDSILGISIL